MARRPQSTRRNLVAATAAAAAAALSAGCTIEHTQPLGADCLVSRECVQGLECAAQPNGRLACRVPRDPATFPPFDASVQDAPPAPDAADDTVTDAPPSDALADGEGGADAGAFAHARFAHLVPSMGRLPALDVCLRAAGSSGAWSGPVLRDDGTAAGLAQNQVSRYLDIPAGAHELLVVAAGASNCDTPLLPPQTGLDLGAAGTYTTVALFGVPQSPDAGASPAAFRARALRDRDPRAAAATPEPPPALRLFDAVPDPALRVDVGVLIDSPSPMFLTVFEDTGFGELGRAPAARPTSVDAQGYYEPSMPLPAVSVGVRATCARVTPPCTNPTLVRADGLAIRARTFSTAFLTVRADGTPAALVCVDTDPPVGGLAACALRP